MQKGLFNLITHLLLLRFLTQQIKHRACKNEKIELINQENKSRRCEVCLFLKIRLVLTPAGAIANNNN